MTKQVEYTVKIVTNSTVDAKALQDAIAKLAFDIHSAHVTNFRVLKQAKP
jgi:hypothetical protein